MRLIGRINKWFGDGRSYGFIKDIEGGNHFLHTLNIISGTPMTNAVVRFTPRATSKGSTALDVEIYPTRQDLEAAVVVETMANSTEVSRGK